MCWSKTVQNIQIHNYTPILIERIYAINANTQLNNWILKILPACMPQKQRKMSWHFTWDNRLSNKINDQFTRLLTVLGGQMVFQFTIFLNFFMIMSVNMICLLLSIACQFILWIMYMSLFMCNGDLGYVRSGRTVMSRPEKFNLNQQILWSPDGHFFSFLCQTFTEHHGYSIPETDNKLLQTHSLFQGPRLEDKGP